jgi:ABC-type polysaccharide/polyol phosphate export permease
LSPITQLWSHRLLIANLAERELKSKYKRSALGWAWSLLNPGLTLAIYSVVFGSFIRIPPPVAGNGELESFALYLFAALVAWNFFNAVVTGSMAALVDAGALLKKVYFPPVCAPVAHGITALNQAAIETGILVVVMLVLGNASPVFLLYPLVLLLLFAFALGFGLMLSISNVYLRDVGYLVGVALQALFYATPIVYTLDYVPERVGPLPAEAIVRLNPLTQFVEASRSIFYLLEVPDLEKWLYLLAWGVGSLAIGWVVFDRTSRDVAEAL